MATRYGKKKNKSNIIYGTIVTVILLCTVFLSLIEFFYVRAENNAYENLHIQTKQIRNDIELQIKSDMENLSTMANFAAGLYNDKKSYDRMFASFEPIGLISNIGILTPDEKFITKNGTLDLKGKIYFDIEAGRGEYISHREEDLTNDKLQILRTQVPIKVGDKTVGILYGVIKLDVINQKYKQMAEDINAQLYVYDKGTGKFIIDTRNDTPQNLFSLKTREYKKGFSYADIEKNKNGYTAFKSIYTNEYLYAHYAKIDVADWNIMLARTEEAVFAETNLITSVLFATFLIMAGILGLYLVLLIGNEKRRNIVTKNASSMRKLLLEINQQHENISEVMKNITIFAKSDSTIFVDTDGEDYNYSSSLFPDSVLKGDEKTKFVAEILRYASQYHNVYQKTVNVMCIRPNKYLLKTNPYFYNFLKENNIFDISFASVIDKNNFTSILGTVNAKKGSLARALLREIAVCFSIAIYNKKHLNRTEVAATTDSLTGAFNRVIYKKDIMEFDETRPEEFSCIYIDVNELHIRNNKYGHASGDEMLIYIANTLKEVFFGHKVYRMGGDEFLVFLENTKTEEVKLMIEEFAKNLEPRDYHVAIGYSYRTQNTNTEEVVREAEIRMYDAKAQYYQNKENKSIATTEDRNYVTIQTGIAEIDTMISVMKEHYFGIYKVSLSTNKARRILMPEYLGYNESEDNFTALLTKYIDETINPDFQRIVMSFLNYDALKSQLMEGKTPRVSYKKVNGETVSLTVYKLSDDNNEIDNTLWVFAKN